MAAEWGMKLLSMALGMAPKLMPQHLNRQALARVRDINPFQRIPNQGDLRRALRLAWIEAALEVDGGVGEAVILDEWAVQADDVRRFSARLNDTLKRRRDEAFDRRQPLPASAIDVHLSEMLMGMTVGSQSTAGGAASGDGLTSSFAHILANETGWPAAEVPLLYAQVAKQGLRQPDGSARSFGELVFDSFAEWLKQPDRYPEASAEFQMAMAGMAREVAVATLQGLQGLDAKLDQALAQLSEAGGFTGLGEFLAAIEQRLLDRLDGMQAVMERELAEMPERLVTALQAGGLLPTGPQALAHQTVMALAQRLRPDESLDFDQALRELKHAVEVARELVASGEHAVTQDAFVDQVLRRVAEETREGRLDAGAEEIDVALANLERQGQALQQRRRTLLEAAVKLAVLRRDAERAAQAVLQIGALDDPVRPAWSPTYSQRLEVFIKEGEQQGINFSLEIAILLARKQVDAANDDERGVAHNWLGLALSRRGERETDTARLKEAVSAFGEALKEHTRRRMPRQQAGMYNNLGLTLMRLGERESGTERLEEAALAFREALKELTRERAPLDWAMAQNNLGNTLMHLSRRNGSMAAMKDAVQAYRAALEEYTRERTPLDWAMTQGNLAVALMRLGERETDTAHLEESVLAFREVLKEQIQDRVPLDWAGTQNNLGTALMLLGQRDDSTERLEEAVLAFREALKEYTRERVPLDWAMTQNNLGSALIHIGERKSGTGRLEEAVQAFREALKEYTRERVPLDWALVQTNLGTALMRLGERESGTKRLEEAVRSFREALKELTRERMPMEWATTQNNLGITLMHLGERVSGTTWLDEAVLAFHEALKEYTRERAPLSWAGTQGNLGSTLMLLGERETGTARLEEAVSAFNEALKELKTETMSWHIQGISGNLQHALALIEQRRSDMA